MPTSPNPVPRFFTVDEIADRWRTSSRKIRRMIDAGELVAHRIGRHVRISEPDLLAYERGCRIVREHRSEAGTVSNSVNKRPK
jgi:excisionase family DNA binding protein